jgi:LysM repeat protein
MALAVFAVVLLVILGSGGGSSPSSSKSTPSRAEQRDLQLRNQRAARRRVRTRTAAVSSVYIVRTGDTLGGIAQRTGVPVTRLQELNPTLDPQALVSGQRIKLR